MNNKYLKDKLSNYILTFVSVSFIINLSFSCSKKIDLVKPDCDYCLIDSVLFFNWENENREFKLEKLLVNDYYKDGQIKEVVDYNLVGSSIMKPFSKHLYKYDSNLPVETELRFWEESLGFNLRLKSRSTYNSKGKLISRINNLYKNSIKENRLKKLEILYINDTLISSYESSQFDTLGAIISSNKNLYSYDDKLRLISKKNEGAPMSLIEYEYKGESNQVSIKKTVPYQFNISYDDNGNLSSIDKRYYDNWKKKVVSARLFQFKFNDENRIRSIEIIGMDGDTTNHFYDYDSYNNLSTYTYSEKFGFSTKYKKYQFTEYLTSENFSWPTKDVSMGIININILPSLDKYINEYTPGGSPFIKDMNELFPRIPASYIEYKSENGIDWAESEKVEIRFKELKH